jgi:hypothetical protein
VGGKTVKTPREILLRRHQEVEHKLDAVRRAALPLPAACSPAPLRDWLRSFRWHAVGLGAAWLVVLCLHMDGRHAPEMMAAIPAAKIPPPRVIMATLRENRRQLSEIIGTDAPVAKPLDLFPVRPRSERREEVFMA